MKSVQEAATRSQSTATAPHERGSRHCALSQPISASVSASSIVTALHRDMSTWSEKFGYTKQFVRSSPRGSKGHTNQEMTDSTRSISPLPRVRHPVHVASGYRAHT